MAEYEEIIIDWKPLKELAKPTRSDADDVIQDNTKEFGNVMYAIYGDSHIYGRDVLMYIGQTARTIEEREQEHANSFFKFVNNPRISIGILTDYSGNLLIPESILIANHKPCMNNTYLHDLYENAKLKKIILINNGNNGMLKTCCTNYWWHLTYENSITLT